MNRALVLLSCFVLNGFVLCAQSIQEGKAHSFAQRYQLADAVFQQLLKANPADAEALYWGGQSAISLELDSTRKPSVARAWYDKAMQTAAASPLVQVGAGQADLYENKINEARQKFESALTQTRTRKGDNADILIAIARANTDAPFHDLETIIAKINAQVEKGEKNAELYLMLGNTW